MLDIEKTKQTIRNVIIPFLLALSIVVVMLWMMNSVPSIRSNDAAPSYNIPEPTHTPYNDSKTYMVQSIDETIEEMEQSTKILNDMGNNSRL